MTIEQTAIIDFTSFDKASGDIWLTIADHLPWSEDEGQHLSLLQDKLNAYLRFIESGQLNEKIPKAYGKPIVINLVGKFRPSEQGELFLRQARMTIEKAGLSLRFELLQPN